MVKKLLIFAVGLMTPIWIHAANGDVAGVVVSSGTFYSIETSSVGTNLRQVVVIGDPSTTKKAPVDTVQGLTVNLASSSAAGIGSLSAGTASIGTVQPGNTQNTVPWQVISTNTVLGTGANTIGAISNTGFNVNNTPAVTQSGTWTVQPGNTQNSTAWQIVSTNTVLGAGTAEIGNVKNSGTFATQDSQAGTWTVQPGNTQNTVPWQVISTNVVIGAGTAEIGNVKNSGTFAVQAAQSGTWTFSPVALTTVTFNGTSQPVNATVVNVATVTQATNSSLRASVDIDGSSNTVKLNDGSGNSITSTANALDVNIKSGAAAGGTSSNFGSAFPGVGTAAGFSNPQGNMSSGKVDASSNVFVTALISGSSNTVQITGTPTVNPGNTQNTVPWQVISTNTVLGTGSNTIGALTANQSVNLAQVGGGTTNTGNGAASGSQRVTVANNQTPFAVHMSTTIGDETNTAVVYVSTFANVAASQTNQVLVSTIAATDIRVVAVFCNAGGTATNINFAQGSGTAISATFAMAINGGFVLPFNPAGWFDTGSGNQLLVTTGAGSTTGCQIDYIKG